jgi:hypothetical protein
MVRSVRSKEWRRGWRGIAAYQEDGGGVHESIEDDAPYQRFDRSLLFAMKGHAEADAAAIERGKEAVDF